ncbi:MAG: hypothetical protein AAGD33_14295 [Actinomycetota bacterium]
MRPVRDLATRPERHVLLHVTVEAGRWADRLRRRRLDRGARH